jgi:hypothetical protein
MARSVALSEVREERRLLLPSSLRPLTFEEFVRLFGEDDDIELVDGNGGAKNGCKGYPRRFARLVVVRSERLR